MFCHVFLLCFSLDMRLLVLSLLAIYVLHVCCVYVFNGYEITCYVLCLLYAVSFRGSSAKTSKEHLLNISYFDIIKKWENEASRF